MGRIPIGVQLYSVREDLQKDVRGTLRAVAQMGYDGVEFAGPIPWPATELRRMLDELGLKCCGWHVPFAAVQDGELANSIALIQILGSRFLIVPGLPRERTFSRQAWLETAGFFDALAAKLAPHALVTGYHNHHTEFQPLDGELPWDIFFGNTRKAVVMQFDIGNALCGGADLLGILRRYPGRAVTVHIKPYSIPEGREDSRLGYRPLVGEDSVPWPEVFELCETIGGTQWYIVEYESDAFPPLEAVERTLLRLKEMGK